MVTENKIFKQTLVSNNGIQEEDLFKVANLTH